MKNKIFGGILFGALMVGAVFAMDNIDVNINGTEAISNPDGTMCYLVKSDADNSRGMELLFVADDEHSQGLTKLKQCDDASLKVGDWAVNFSYGTVRGGSICGDKPLDEYEDLNKANGVCRCVTKGLYASMTDSTPILEFDYYEVPSADSLPCHACSVACSKWVKDSVKARSKLFYGIVKD